MVTTIELLNSMYPPYFTEPERQCPQVNDGYPVPPDIERLCEGWKIALGHGNSSQIERGMVGFGWQHGRVDLHTDHFMPSDVLIAGWVVKGNGHELLVAGHVPKPLKDGCMYLLDPFVKHGTQVTFAAPEIAFLFMTFPRSYIYAPHYIQSLMLGDLRGRIHRGLFPWMC